MSARTQGTALLVLGAIWAGVALWVVMNEPEPQHVPLTHVTGRAARADTGRTHAGAGLKVHLDRLAAARRQAEEALVAPKNIFAPLRSDEPKVAVAKPLPKAPEPPPAAPAAPPPPSAEELAAQAARQELAQFRYLGYLNRPDKEEAFLSKGKDLHIVKSGDTIDQRVLVKAITSTGVTLEEPTSHVERTVLLADGK